MSTAIAANEAHLRGLYQHGSFRGHGFICAPATVSISEWPLYDYTLSDRPVSEWVPWVVENYRRQVDLLAAVGDDNVPCARLTTGTHLYAAAFGCQVHRFVDNNPCAVPCVRTPEEADRLPEPSVWSSPALYRCFELAAKVQEALGPDAYLGPPDVQSGFDTASLIWNKEEFLIALVDEEQAPAARRLIAKCARLLKGFLYEFRKAFPRCSACHCPNAWAPPDMGPWLSNDECGSLSVELFESFCLPELVDLSTTFGGLGMHCCADAEHQFASFRKIPDFYAFNRVPARRGFDTILEPFGGPAAPLHVIAWIQEADIERLITRASPGTRFLFELSGVTDAGEARRWLERVRRIPTPGVG
jgi:hypothetical protein